MKGQIITDLRRRTGSSVGAMICTFRPRLIPTLATLALLAGFVALGLWQLDRAREKQEMQELFLVRDRLAPLMVTGQQLEPEAFDFRNASASGQYEPDYQILLDNKVHRGQAGYHVLTPLRVRGSDRRLLVNRGWIPWGSDRQRLPVVDTPSGEVNVSGRLRKPATAAFTLQDAEPSEFLPVWQQLDLVRYSRMVGFPVQPMVLELAPNPPNGYGLVREWPAYQNTWIQRHRAYAFQWFSLGAALVVIYLVVNIRRSSSQDGEV